MTGRRKTGRGPGARLRAASTRQLLWWHLVALLVLGAVGSCALLVSYDEVHRTPARVRDNAALAVQEVAAARIALDRAQRTMQRTVDSDVTKVVGEGEEFRTELSAADQNLSRAADRQLAGEQGRISLDTVNGLLTVYADAVSQATGTYVDEPLMRQVKMTEAESILRRDETGILPRLGVLQARQLAAMHRDLTPGPGQRAGWAVAEACLLGTVGLLVSAMAVLRRRCGRLVNPWLLAGLVLTVLLAVVPLYWTVTTQGLLDTGGARLAGLERASSQQTITEVAAQVRGAMDSAHGRAAPLLVFATGCGVMLALPLTGLLRRILADYGRS